MKNCFRFLAFIYLLFTIGSCKKDPGTGGNSSITGYVHLIVTDPFDLDTTAVDGYNEDVFLIYGNDIGFSDRTRTGYDGKFEFKYLRKGKYRVYVYSESNTVILGYNPDKSIIKSVEITDKKQNVDAGTFEIRKYK